MIAVTKKLMEEWFGNNKVFFIITQFPPSTYIGHDDIGFKKSLFNIVYTMEVFVDKSNSGEFKFRSKDSNRGGLLTNHTNYIFEEEAQAEKFRIEILRRMKHSLDKKIGKEIDRISETFPEVVI